jgi:tellurite resistance protein TerC
MKHLVSESAAEAKRVTVIVVDFSILIIGMPLIVLPGSAFVVIPIGVTLLATEYIRERRVLDSVKERIERMRKKR